MDLNETNVSGLIRWMEERQRIYLLRMQGVPPPWTKDVILQQYRFCNVYREQDKTTVWLQQQWREPYHDHPNLWFAMCLARQINYIDTLAAIGFPRRWMPERALQILKDRQQRKLKTYTSAYMLCCRSLKGQRIKPYWTINGVLEPLWNATRRRPPIWCQLHCSLEHAWMVLCQMPGFGPFLSYEVVTDLRHTRYLRDASDIYVWANLGPGARRGLNRLCGRPVRAHVPQRQLLAEARQLLTLVASSADRKLLPTLELRDIEHSLCEFDKYCRVSEARLTGQRIGLERFRVTI